MQLENLYSISLRHLFNGDETCIIIAINDFIKLNFHDTFSRNNMEYK